ncbi:gastric triacylglycerol lipase-like [Amphiura filiformis]|uniref:gastric triacylglycerol lipase-like n=1 Tax=Amphiura filiformis TaxID=82378 RepID=UPI003B20EAD3
MMNLAFICLVFIYTISQGDAGILSRRVDPEVAMDATELITSKGYPCENHFPVTEDGFILNIQRIPYGRNEKAYTPRPVVFLQHGLIASATNWITNLANNSFAFILADAGFDVWLGNSRGNKYSQGNIHLRPDQDEFWDWSWDQMAKYDLPASIDYALMFSKQKQVYYVGHSQGSTIGFAGFSQNKNLASKIKHFFALGPVSTVGQMTSPLRLLADFLPEMEFVFKLLGVQDFMPSNAVTQWFASDVCSGGHASLFCSNIIFVLCGYDEKNLNMTRIPVYFSHCPSGTSVQDMIHFAQMVNSGKFQMYDYGSEEKNMERYNQTTPPLYDASKMTVPVSLYWGGQDWLADPSDVLQLIPQLTNIRNNVELKDYDHLDFLWGMDATKRVYQPIINEILKMERETEAWLANNLDESGNGSDSWVHDNNVIF